VIAVYRDEQEARRAAEGLRQSGDVGEVRVGDRADEQQVLRSEMQEEMEHTFVGPGNVGPFTKEMAKGTAVGTLVATAFGAIAALPFGLLEFGPALWQRFLVAAAVGAFAGATVGFVAGGGLAAKGPADPLAGEEGVAVAVTATPGEETERVARLLAAHDPIRLDVTDSDGRVVDTVRFEDESVAHHLGETLRRPAGDWSGARHDR
jgi:outer membrane lipoprotein SlyB